MRRGPAELLFDYLYLRDDEPGRADVVIGFGHFDLKIPRRCVELHRAGAAPRIVFTGGIGAGTADLGQPEAQAFRGEAVRLGVSEAQLLVEDGSRNTGENVRETARLLSATQLPLGGVTRSALIVASPYRQRRVYLTCRRHFPEVDWRNAPPQTSFEEECRLFGEKDLDLPDLLKGEIDRLSRYPARGFCEAAQIPSEIVEAARLL